MARIGAVRSNTMVQWGRRWGDLERADRRRMPRTDANAQPAPAPTNLPVALDAPEPRARIAASQRPAAPFIAQLLADRIEDPARRRNGRPGADVADALYQARNASYRPSAPGSIIRRDA
ncbi:hypothetical protein [Phreatobacter aquaticus]|uniref:hypothetical protein n=1 Tax=Phreatobacter aquaticus TaxID=2570229 RepID=UPI00143D7530|nr:hypothetical protein [Phreatobacter aquaticus]